MKQLSSLMSSLMLLYVGHAGLKAAFVSERGHMLRSWGSCTGFHGLSKHAHSRRLFAMFIYFFCSSQSRLFAVPLDHARATFDG